jgi:hypothetical protein
MLFLSVDVHSFLRCLADSIEDQIIRLREKEGVRVRCVT